MRHVTLIVLNQLSNEPHNAFMKCFASQKRQREAAFKVLTQTNWQRFSLTLRQFLAGLRTIWSIPQGDEMNKIITPELVMELGKEFQQKFLEGLPAQERIAGLKPEEIVPFLKPEERLAGLEPEELS